MAKDIAAQTPAQVAEKIEAEPGSQIDFANKLAERVRGWLRYVAEEKDWFAWDGKVWRRDELGKVLNAIKDYVGKVSISAAESAGARRAFASQRTIAGIELILRRCAGIAATVEQWDADPTLLCTPGGIVELTTGEQRAAVPEDYCRKITAVGPAEPGTPLGETFQKLLGNLTSGDKDMQKYLQKVAGYCLYGVQLEKVIFIVVGEHDSGKSTMFKTFCQIMSDYASPAQVALFLEDPRNFGNASTNDLAELAGYRLIVTGEPDKGAALSAAKLKVLVGVDEQRLRLNYRQGKAGPTTYNLIIHCNEIPRLGRGGDAALRGRLRILDGGKTIAEADRTSDVKLGALLRAEFPSILRWMIGGAVLLSDEGLGALPASSAAVRDEYFSDENPLTDWLEHRVDLSDGSHFTSREAAFADFRAFCPYSPLDLDRFVVAVKDHRWFETNKTGERIERQFHYLRKDVGGAKARGFLGLKLGVQLW